MSGGPVYFVLADNSRNIIASSHIGSGDDGNVLDVSATLDIPDNATYFGTYPFIDLNEPYDDSRNEGYSCNLSAEFNIVAKGKDGITPHIGANGNWYIGETDTGVKAEGEDGRGIKTVARTSGTGAAGTTDTYTITYTDNTTSTFTVYNGKNGKDYVLTEADKAEIAGMVEENASAQIGAHNTDTSAHADIREQVNTSIEDAITDLKAQGVQQVPLFAESVEWLNDPTNNADTTKLYVVDGWIYAYQYVEATEPSYTNLAGTITYDRRLSSSGKASSSAIEGACYTDFIPVKKGQIVRIKNMDVTTPFSSSAYPYICFYTGASENSPVTANVWDRFAYLLGANTPLVYTEADGTVVYTAFVASDSAGGYSGGGVGQHTLADTITHLRFSGWYESGKEIIVTVDEEITEGSSGGSYSWESTGHAFVPADYEAIITDLQNNKANKTDIPKKLPNPNKLTIDGVDYDGSTNVNIETQSGGNILYGKKWVACGDSFTANGYNASDGFDESEYIYQDGRFAGRYKVYPNIIGLRNNMNIVNLATGGQTMATTAANNSFMTRYANIDADADYITIMLGINDKLQGVPLGTLTSVDTTTFCGAFNVAMEHIIENHPFAHIGIMVSHGTNAEIMQATRDIAERWGVPYLDYGSPQVPLMNRYTGKWEDEGGKVCDKARQIREKNFCVISDGTTPTNAHPNTAAHEYESTFIEAWLKTL